MALPPILDKVTSFIIDPGNNSRKPAEQGLACATTIILGVGTFGVGQGLSVLWRNFREVEQNDTHEKIDQLFKQIFFEQDPDKSPLDLKPDEKGFVNGRLSYSTSTSRSMDVKSFDLKSFKYPSDKITSEDVSSTDPSKGSSGTTSDDVSSTDSTNDWSSTTSEDVSADSTSDWSSTTSESVSSGYSDPESSEGVKDVSISESVSISLEPEKYSTEQIQKWLFEGYKDPDFPMSQLAFKQENVRKKDASQPKVSFSEIEMLNRKGKYTSRIGIYNGGVTDIKAEKGQKAAIGDSNNGDLLTGCGFAVATAIINATGPNLQKDLYNKFGVPGVMGVSTYGKDNYRLTEGRGYALTCDAHEMKESHNIQTVEFMTVPMYNINGVRNMYAEAYEHSKDLDFIVMPMAGMNHPVLQYKPQLSAQIATEEFKKFVNRHPESELKVVFAIYKDPKSEQLYKEAAKKLK